MPVFDPAFDIAYEAGSFPPAFEIPTFPASVQRYITSLSAAGLMYFQPSTSPTVTRIVMDVNSPTGSIVGLPTGAPSVTANEFQTIDFAYSGTLPTFGKNGTEYFTGEIKNIKAYNGASLVWDAEIKEDWASSTDIHDAQGNVVGSAINITQNETESYTLIDSGTNWIGVDLVTNGSFDSDTDWIKGVGWDISAGSLNMTVAQGSNSATTQILGMVTFNIYRIGYSLDAITGEFVPYAGTGASGIRVSVSGDYTDDIVAGSGGVLYLFGRTGFTGSVDNVSARRLIPIAQEVV